MTEPLPAQAVFQALEAGLRLRWIGGERSRLLREEDNRGLPLAGRLNWIEPPMVQIVGAEELGFLDSLDGAVREALIRRLLAAETGAVLVCEQPARAEAWRAAADAGGMPLWYTPDPPAAALERLNDYQRGLGVCTLVHGEFLEVFGLGVLLTGDSGIGKSELALELVSRGHRLIADDTPELTRVAATVIEGTCPLMLRDFLEVRGLGILNIRRMFGDSAIKRNKRVRLIIHLVRQEETPLAGERRLQGAREHRTILGVAIPLLDLPVAPGRNLAVLVECAVRDHIQRLGGYRAEQDLMGRLHHEMSRQTLCE